VSAKAWLQRCRSLMGVDALGIVGAWILPVSVRQQIFWGVCLTFVVCYILGSWVNIPFVLIAPIAMLVIHVLLVRKLDRPIRSLLQLTRQGGFDIAGPIAQPATIGGRDEFSRVARAVFGMAKRMRRSMVEAREQTTRVDEIFSAIGEGVIILSLSGKIQKINNTVRRWVGWYGDVAGRDVVDVVRSVELASRLADIAKQVQEHHGVAFDFEPVILESLHIEGPETKRVRAKIIFLDSKPQAPVFMVFLFDITDLHRLEVFRREFFANVSHELKTPISAIRGYAEILQSLENVTQDETAVHFLQVIERNSQQLSKMIDEMLTLAGLEAGTITLDPKPYDVRQAATQVVETLLPKAREAKVSLELDIATDVQHFTVDRQRFDSVLLNLVDNAIKYNKPEGYVKISARQTARHSLLYVEDSGQGLPDEAQLRAFERFYRVDRAHTRLGGGSGLGLAIVKHVVQAHGGQIGLRSELGVGTVVTVTLPRHPFQGKITLAAPV
jgi:two-component system, OmpR family, phosphate regulon sensor histidine kinase PhoR